MSNRAIALAIALAIVAAPAAAQTVSGDRVTLNTGPCTMRSGFGIPATNPAMASAKVCDTYLDAGSGELWLRQSSGWVLPGGIGGGGTIGTLTKWTGTSTIGDSSVREVANGGNLDLVAQPTANLRLVPTGDIYLGPTGNDVLPVTGYSTNLGAINNKLLAIHGAELWVQTLVRQNTMATSGGRWLVGPTTQLARDLPATGGQFTIYVKDNNLELATATRHGSVVYLESNGKFESMQMQQTTAPVQQADGSWAYLMARDFDGSGANVWYAGDAVFIGGGLNTDGTAGGGWIDVYSISGVTSYCPSGTQGPCAPFAAGPTIAGNVRTGFGPFAYEPRWAIGNLNGLYGYSQTTYGAVFGRPGGARLTVDTAGITMYDGLNNIRAFMTAGGTAGFVGDGSGVTNINGGNIQTGTISANKLTVGSGVNLIRNPDCTNSTADWTLYTSTSAVMGGPYPAAVWGLGNIINNCYIALSAAPPAGAASIIYGGGYQGAGLHSVPVIAGRRYEASAYFGVHNSGNTYTSVQWFDASDAFLAQNNGNMCTGAIGGTYLANYCRSGIVVTAPAGATSARLALQTEHLAGVAGQTIFMVHIFFGEALPNQTELSPYSGVTEIIGGMIRTDSIDARAIAAGAITASEIATGTITGDKLAFKSITSDKINVTELSAITSNMGTLTAGTINGGTINGTTINGGTISGATLCAPSCAAPTFTVAGSSGTVIAQSAQLGTASSLSTVNMLGHVSLAAGGSSLFFADISQLRFSGYTTAGFNHLCFGTGGIVYACSDNSLLAAPAVAALLERVEALEAALAALPSPAKGAQE